MFIRIKHVMIVVLFFASLLNFIASEYMLSAYMLPLSDSWLRCTLLFSITYGTALLMGVAAWKD